MELISTYICKSSDIGLHSNMFGGNMLKLIDECSAAYAAQICDDPRVVTIKIDELVFKKPVKVGAILKCYGEVKEFGNTSVTLYIEMRKHNVHNGSQEVVTHTNIKFVRIDAECNPVAIEDRVKVRYYDRLKNYGKGLLSDEERKSPIKKPN